MPSVERNPSSLSIAGRSSLDGGDSSSVKSSINREYRKACRIESYVEIVGLVEDLQFQQKSSRSARNWLLPLIWSLDFHPLLVDHGLEPCRICESLLLSSHQTRANHRRIRSVIELLRETGKVNASQNEQEEFSAACVESAAFPCLANPLFLLDGKKFENLCHGIDGLQLRIEANQRTIKRRETLKRVGNCGTRSSCGLGAAVCRIATRIVAAYCLQARNLGLRYKRVRPILRNPKINPSRRVTAKLGEGLLGLKTHIDTVRSLSASLPDEVERYKAWSEMCVRSSKCEVVKEVMKQLDFEASKFERKLEEMDQLIYHCLRTIRESIRLIAEETMATRHGA